MNLPPMFYSDSEFALNEKMITTAAEAMKDNYNLSPSATEDDIRAAVYAHDRETNIRKYKLQPNASDGDIYQARIAAGDLEPMPVFYTPKEMSIILQTICHSRESIIKTFGLAVDATYQDIREVIYNNDRKTHIQTYKLPAHASDEDIREARVKAGKFDQ